MSARFAVLGSPIAHSLSPPLHRAAFRALARDATYEAIDVAEPAFEATLARLVAGGYAGVNLTAPLKAAGLRVAHVASAMARAAGAVNTLALRGGRIEGENTDGPGFVAFLDAAGIDVRRRAIAFLGGGGATAGLVPALREAGAGPITVVTRTPERARARFPSLASAAVAVVSAVAAREAIAAAALVVQATPVVDPMPCPPEWVGDRAVAVDLLYHPAVTPWLAALRARGVRAANGLGLLVEQARLAQRFWFGETPPRRALEEALAWPDPFSPPPQGDSPGSGSSGSSGVSPAA